MTTYYKISITCVNHHLEDVTQYYLLSKTSTNVQRFPLISQPVAFTFSPDSLRNNSISRYVNVFILKKIL